LSSRRVPDIPEVGVVPTGNGVTGVRYPASPGVGLAVAVGPLPPLPWFVFVVGFAPPLIVPDVSTIPDPVDVSVFSSCGEMHPERHIIATRMRIPAIVILFPVIKGGWCPPLFIYYGKGKKMPEKGDIYKKSHFPGIF
jgi:hypothetical protein